jgi:hypothetical protein
MILKQLSVFLENQPGALRDICALLAGADINILTFSLADAREFGIFRVIVHEWEATRELLAQNSYPVKVTDVVALDVHDRPGGLLDVLTVIEQAGVNLEYIYAVPIRRAGKGVMVFRFNDPDTAIRALQAAHIDVVDPAGLLQRVAP